MTPTERRLAIAGALHGLVGVAAGAFGAHALRERLPLDLLAIFETGARYQVYHSLALFGAAWIFSRTSSAHVARAGWLFVAGIIIFSGSLYLLAITGVRRWGAVTPIGGLLLLGGWASLALGLLKARASGPATTD